MPDRTFDVLIDIQARVQAIQDASKQMANLNKEAVGVGNALKLGFSIDIAHRFTEALQEIPRLLKEGLETGIEFNKIMEQGRLGVAGLLTQFEPARYKGFTEALGDSDRLLDLLRGKA